ncbi:MAG: DUF6057 family protein [Bacteroidaceae bacterium]|nr:DUF6057 family protein [Bacteroidaceae bacterium]
MATKKTNNLNYSKKPSFVSESPKAQKKEAGPFCLSAKTTNFLPWFYALFFAVLAAYYLIEKNSDVLYMAQSRNLFLENCEYFADCMKQPGGIMFWAGTYLTQYFFYPTSGACILIGIWVLTFAVTKYAFNMKNGWTVLALIPLVGLLCSDILTGYWIFYLKHPGYWFTTSIAFFTAMLATLVGRIIPEKGKIAWIILWTFFGYVGFGWTALFGTLYICINYTINTTNKQLKPFIIPAISVASIILVPILCYHFYTNIRIEDGWIVGLPLFWAGQDITYIAELPFIIMAIAPLTFAFFSKKDNESKDVKGTEAYSMLVIAIALLGASVYITDKVNYDNYNYHAELRIVKAAEEQQWNDILTEMANIPGDATRQMVLFKNIALLNTGHLGDGLFRFNNMGEPPYVYDSLKVHMVQTGAPLIYYYHGKTNFAYRWCIENSVEFGFKVQDIKNLVRCTIISQEWDVAKKYLNILKKTTFHKEWAEHYERLIDNPKLIDEYHEFDNVRELYSHMGTVLDGDNGLPEMYIINYFSNTMNKDSKLLQELTLAYALIQKDIQHFWPRFFLYAQLHSGDKMPIHYQEAAFLYGNLEPQNVDIRKMPFDKEKVIDKYASFHNMSQQIMADQTQKTGTVDVKKVGEIMKPIYGDTFYWFYFFCRDVKSN